MIMVKIEMWPGGDSTRKRDLAAIAIANVGGDSDTGDYAYSVSHQIDSVYGGNWAGHQAFAAMVGMKTSSCWKAGQIAGFSRQLGVVKLLLQVLRACKI